MPPLSSAFHSPAMGCTSAAAASARFSCPASTPLATAAATRHPARPFSPSALPRPQINPTASQPTSSNSSPMLNSLFQLRFGCPGSHATAARLRSAVRTCALARSASSPCPSTPASAAPWGLHPQAPRSPSGSAGPSPRGLVMASGIPRRSAQGRVLWTAGSHCGAAGLRSAAVAMQAAPAAAWGQLTSHETQSLGQGHRHRRMATQARPSGSADSSASPSKKQKKQKQRVDEAPAADVASAAAEELEAAAGAAPAAAPAAGLRYSPLHYNIEDFCSRVVLTEGEKRARMEVIDGVRSCLRKVWPSAKHVELQVFGSFANGLSTWSSDVDLVVTGVMEPDRLTGGFEHQDRTRITSRLRKLGDALDNGKNVGIKRQQLIPRARIPILKLWTRAHVCVDVSICDENGPRAARYMVQQCRAFPPLKPLVLVLKSYLKACKLNEVNTGGLSSYSLTNMVIAHLQEELKSGHDISDLGETLYTFLLRYGEEHDYSNMAVSVASGGVVPKAALGFAMESARQAALSMGAYDGAVSWQERLCVDCPLTGRDVSTGTFRIDLVKGAFVQAARKLEALARGRRVSDTSLNYLQALFDVNRVLKRSYPDPNEPVEDEYLKVLGGRGGRAAGADEEEGEELLAGDGWMESEGDDEDGLDGDHLERRTTAAATSSAAAGRGGQRRGR